MSDSGGGVARLSSFVPRVGSTLLGYAACLLVITLVAGCGSESGPERTTPVPFHVAETGKTPFGDIPWPSDLYLDADGSVGEVPGLDRIASLPGPIARGLASLDGFGRSTGALFFLEDDIDTTSLPRTWDEANARGASVLLADVDPRSPRLGSRYPAYAKFLPSLGCLSLIPVPGVVLPPGVRHAAVLTRRVVTPDGVHLSAGAELARVLTLSPGQRATKVEQLYGDAADQLVATGVVRRRDDIASLAVFTTSARVFELPRLRARLRYEPEPELIVDPQQASPYTAVIFGAAATPSLDDWLGYPMRDEDGREWPGGDNPGGIAHDQVGVIASGAFVAPSFLNRLTQHFEVDASSGEAVLAAPDAKIPVTLMLPKQPPPPNGYPVVIHGHGLSNHRGSMLGIVNELARAGFAMIAIDDVQHGSRQGLRDQLNNFSGSYRGPDGIPDTVGLPIAFFAGFADFVAMRDNFRQTVLDETSLVRLIQSSRLDLSALARAAGNEVATLDPQRIYWSGGSLGGIMGAMTIAIEPEIRAAALQVPGASFVQLITTGSAELAPLVSTLANAALGVKGDEVTDEFHPVANLLAAVTESGDPIGYAPHVLHDPLLPERDTPDVLITYAVYDEVLPNIATVALMRALGVSLASPHLLPLPGIPIVAAPVVANVAGHTAAAVQYQPANHGLGYSRYETRKFHLGVPFEEGERFPHLPQAIRFEQPIREHLRQLVTFFESVAQGGPGRVEITKPPVADYDGDGILDEEERANGGDFEDPGR